MSVYRDEGRGTWYVQASYHDSHGRRHRTTKRGFATRREAQAWERDFVGTHSRKTLTGNVSFPAPSMCDAEEVGVALDAELLDVPGRAQVGAAFHHDL